MSDSLAETPYRIVFEEYPNYLYALVHSEQYGYEVLTRFLREIADECKKRGFRQVVIEENISATASEEDVVRIASELPQLGFSDIRMAYIDRFLDQKGINEMGQDVAVHHGIDVRIFTNQLDAERWLSTSGTASA
ncbi:MAG TPA: hypothetical protein VGQ55_02180 [Pyrinomonadaceae bacterium]|nr:hypothetical protein [Pyrinomonadaceae bacterium]